jgi:hypothetical protein
MSNNIEPTLINIDNIINKKQHINNILEFIQPTPKSRQSLEIPKIEPIVPKPFIPDEIKILSYNVMRSVHNEKCKKIEGEDYDVCYENVIKFINEDEYDFIGLQDVDIDFPSYEPFKKARNIANMGRNVKTYADDKNTGIITMYDKKYKLDDDINVINGEIKGILKTNTTIGLFTILFFKGKLCVINIMMSRIGMFKKHFDESLKNTIETIKSDEEKKSVRDKLRGYHIIMIGDLHEELKTKKIDDYPTYKTNTQIFVDEYYGIDNGRDFYGINNDTKSCCDSNLREQTGYRSKWPPFYYYYNPPNSMEFSYDYILSTWKNTGYDVSEPKDAYGMIENKNASDHLPTIGHINTTIGGNVS